MFFGLNLSSFLNGDRHNWIPCFWNHPKLCWTIMQLSTKKNQEQVAWLPRCFWGHPKGSTGLMTWIFKLGCEVFCFSKQILGFFYQLNTFSVMCEKVLCILIYCKRDFKWSWNLDIIINTPRFENFHAVIDLYWKPYNLGQQV